MKSIRFHAQGSNSVIGNFGPGDVARVDDKFAKHLVDEAKVAKYYEPEAVKPARAAPAKKAEPKAAAKPSRHK